MTLANYLAPRGKRGTYQLRVPVPKAIQDAIGTTERIRSMRTSDRELAARRAMPVLTEWLNDFDRAAGGRQQAVNDAPALAVSRAYGPTLDKLEALRRAIPNDDAAYSAFLEKTAAALRTATRLRMDGIHEQWEIVADRMIANGYLPIIKGTDEYSKFVEGIADSVIDAYSVHNRKSAGEIDAEPQSKIVRRSLELEANTAPVGEKLLDLFEKYAAGRLGEGKRADTINQDRKVIESFADFIGRNCKVAAITGVDVRDWIDTVAALPPNFRKMKAYRDLSTREAAAKARTEDVSGPKLTTLNKYLSTLSPFFRWMKKRDYHPGPNPCDGLFWDVPKGSNPRPPFTTAQLNTILASPLFTGFEADGKEHLKGTCRADDYRYWVPLVCLFTGARLGEVAQLRTEDVRKERGVWFIHIRHDESTGQTTKSGYSRAAPIHSKLIELGFLAFHKRQLHRAERDGNDAMFPKLEKNVRGQISGKVGRWWRDYLEDIGVKDGGDGFGSHSFRHTMADLLRYEAELLDDQIEVALGHNQKTTTGGYGRLKQGTVTMLQAYFEGVRFEGVDFSVLA
jgi:integrase